MALTLGTWGLLWGTSSALAGPDKVAMVIGNGAYDHTPQILQAPRDARLVATELDKLGFEVRLTLDADLATFRRDLLAFAEAARGAEVSFVYFAGHGLQVDGTNYLVPIDATLSVADQVRYQTLSADELLVELARADVPLNVVVLDACRENPFASNWQGTGRSVGNRGLARIDAERLPPGFLLAYSTDADGVAKDNGAYAELLVEHLRAPCRDLDEVFRQVRDGLVAETGQRPWTEDSTGMMLRRTVISACPSRTCLGMARAKGEAKQLELLQAEVANVSASLGARWDRLRPQLEVCTDRVQCKYEAEAFLEEAEALAARVEEFPSYTVARGVQCEVLIPAVEQPVSSPVIAEVQALLATFAEPPFEPPTRVESPAPRRRTAPVALLTSGAAVAVTGTALVASSAAWWKRSEGDGLELTDAGIVADDAEFAEQFRTRRTLQQVGWGMVGAGVALTALGGVTVAMPTEHGVQLRWGRAW